MQYRLAQPSQQLSKFVKHYWTLDSSVPNGQDHIQRIVPTGLTDLIFYFGDKPKSTNRTKPHNESTLISGQLGNYYDLRVTGKLSLFSIIFQPHGLSMFLDIPIHELYDYSVPLKFVFRDNVDELETKLYEADSFAKRISIAELYLLKLLRRGQQKYSFERITESMRLINRARGMVGIDFLASEVCYSRKQFERNFSYCIGTSPKQFLKIIRFQNAINNKSKNKDINLTELTYQCGYYDQSHMINDFHKFTGMSPKQYFADCEPFSDYFQ